MKKKWSTIKSAFLLTTTICISASADDTVRSKLDKFVNHYALVLAEDENLAKDRLLDYFAKQHLISAEASIEQYRATGIKLNNSHVIGKTSFTLALIADQVPPLKKDDVVEVRYVGIDFDDNFDGNKEANIIFRLVCKSESPDYQTCLKSIPSYRGNPELKMLPTKTPYPPSWHSLGLTITKQFSPEGEPLPNVPPLIPR